MKVENPREIQGENFRKIVSLERGAIARIRNLFPSRVPSSFSDIVIESMCTAYNPNLMNIVKVINNLSKTNT